MNFLHRYYVWIYFAFVIFYLSFWFYFLPRWQKAEHLRRLMRRQAWLDDLPLNWGKQMMTILVRYGNSEGDPTLFIDQATGKAIRAAGTLILDELSSEESDLYGYLVCMEIAPSSQVSPGKVNWYRERVKVEGIHRARPDDTFTGL